MQKTVRGILFVFLIVGNVSFSQNYWLRQPSPTLHNLSKCIFADSLNGWAAGDSAVIIGTSNGGQNWVVQTSGIASTSINDIYFLNKSLGWALCNDYSTSGTIILKTINGGLTWSNSRFSDTTVFMQTIYFVDSLNGYIGGVNSKLFKTTNSGLNWNKCTIDTSSCFGLPIWKLRFLNPQTGYACGGGFDINGQVWKTTNSGAYWTLFCLAAEPLFDIAVQNNKVIACGGDFEFGGIIAFTTNTGNNWSLRNSGCFGIAQSIAFRTPAELWMPLGFSGYWALNTDSGTSGRWQCIPTPDSSQIYACQFTSSTSGWAFGTDGSIFKYNTGIIGISGNQNGVPQNNELFQNYPNPFNPVTSIKFKIVNRNHVNLKIFDLLGKEVRTLFEGNKEPGEYSIGFDASDFPSGVYFYILETGNTKISKKMVLIK